MDIFGFGAGLLGKYIYEGDIDFKEHFVFESHIPRVVQTEFAAVAENF